MEMNFIKDRLTQGLVAGFAGWPLAGGIYIFNVLASFDQVSLS